MELEVTKYLNKTESNESIKIESYKTITYKTDLLLVKEFDMTENNQKIDFIDIRKIQFIASCKTKFDYDILVAFYLNEDGYLAGHIISDLPREYFSHKGFLIDYKSYSDICDLTNEKRLSFIEYFQTIKNSYVGVNTIAKFQDKLYNYTEQEAQMWKEIGN